MLQASYYIAAQGRYARRCLAGKTTQTSPVYVENKPKQDNNPTAPLHTYGPKLGYNNDYGEPCQFCTRCTMERGDLIRKNIDCNEALTLHKEFLEKKEKREKAIATHSFKNPNRHVSSEELLCTTCSISFSSVFKNAIFCGEKA